MLGVLPLNGLAEAVAVARDTTYGPHATVFTQEHRQGD